MKLTMPAPMIVNIQDEIISGATTAGLMIPEETIKKMTSLPALSHLELPPISEVLSEVLLERMSIRGKAWIWSNRTVIPRSYESDLLNEMGAVFEKEAESLNRHLSGSLAQHIDPRLAVFLSMPQVSPAQWIEHHDKCIELLSLEAQSLAQSLDLPGHGSADIKPIDVRRFVSDLWSSDEMSRLEYLRLGGKDVFKVQLGTFMDLVISGQIDITLHGKKPYVDMSLLSHGSQGEVRARIGMEMVADPYGNLYLAQRQMRKDTLINIRFGLVVFSAVAGFLHRSM